MTPRRQVQSGGPGSWNVQAENVTLEAGLTVEDAADLARALVREEFAGLVDVAVETAGRRAEDLVTALLERVTQQAPEAIQAFRDPDVQYVLRAAQRAYARTGDKDLGEMLVGVLTDRVQHLDRDLRQIVLNESLEVVPRLMPDQLAALSVLFVVAYMGSGGVRDRQALHDRLDTMLVPFLDQVALSEASYRHLEYAGCAAVSHTVRSIESLVGQHFAGLFSKGFTAGRLDAAGEPPSRWQGVVVRHPDDPRLLQFDVVNEEDLLNRTTRAGAPPDVRKRLSTLLRMSTLNGEGMRAALVDCHPAMADLFRIWEGSPMQHTSLTSVGVAIGHANCRRTVGASPGDLATWVD